MRFIWIFFYKLIFNPVIFGLFFPLLLIHRKSRQSVLAHAGLFKRIEKKLLDSRRLMENKRTIWIHVASAGEYLQVKSLVKILARHGYPVFITVTSISGYNWLKRENNKNIIFDFLPLDFTFNAKKLLNLVQPAALVFVKTDIWPNLLVRARKENIPTALVCAPERKISEPSNQTVKKTIEMWIKESFYKFLYANFTAVFPTTGEGEKFYKKILSSQTTIKTVGDGKYDIVLERKKDKTIKLPSVKKSDVCVLLGSVWPEDLKVIAAPVLASLGKYPNLKIIVAPHENDDKHVNELVNLFKQYNPVLFGDFQSKAPRSQTVKKNQQITSTGFRVLVVNTIGDLFFLYENSQIAYVGGGFSTGIHNILEPCAMKNTVIFGPRYGKFPEAEKLISLDCACSIKNTAEFDKVFNDLVANKKLRHEKGEKSYTFITQHKGASQKLYENIMNILPQ